MNQSCHLFAAQLASVQGRGGGCSSVGSESLSYSCAPCCQAILRGLDANELLGQKQRGGGEAHSGSNFFKGKGKDVTQSSPRFIKQGHVWTHFIPLEVEGKGFEDHVESSYNTEDAPTVIATKRKYSAKSMPRTATTDTRKNCMKTRKKNERKTKHRMFSQHPGCKAHFSERSQHSLPGSLAMAQTPHCLISSKHLEQSRRPLPGTTLPRVPDLSP